MTDDRTTAGRPAEERQRATQTAATRPPLTSEDIRRLTLYKWRYSLESTGFTAEQVGRLLFLKWLYATSIVRG